MQIRFEVAVQKASFYVCNLIADVNISLVLTYSFGTRFGCWAHVGCIINRAANQVQNIGQKQKCTGEGSLKSVQSVPIGHSVKLVEIREQRKRIFSIRRKKLDKSSFFSSANIRQCCYVRNLNVYKFEIINVNYHPAY